MEIASLLAALLILHAHDILNHNPSRRIRSWYRRTLNINPYAR